MKQVADTHHLWKRGSVWYFRRKVPTNLVEKAGTPVVQYSLQTGDKREAQRRARVEDLKFDRWIADLEAGTTIPPTGKGSVSAPRQVSVDELIEFTRSFVETEDGRRAKRLLADPPDDADQREDMLIEAGVERAVMQSTGHPERHRLVDRTAEKIAENAGLSVEAPATLFALAGRALVEIARRHEARLEGDHGTTSFDAMFAPGASDAKPKVRVSTLAEQFLAETREEHTVNGIAAKRTEKVEATMEYLVEALGAETPVATLDDDAMQLLRKMVAKTPANRNKIFPGLSLAEQLDRAEKEGKPIIQHLTQRGHLEVLRNFLRFAVRKKVLPSNPAEGLQPLLKETVPLSEKRRPFSIDQLRQLFTGAFYQSCAPGTAVPYAKPDRAWRFWLPLIMLFSGCRPNEACSLTVDDIRQTAKGTWYFDFNDEGDEKSLKNSASRRRVPIHPQLVSIGFINFAADRRSKMKKFGRRLFPELKPKNGEPGNLAWYATRRFNEFFLPAEVKMEDRQSLYSLRHSVRDALRRIKASEEALFVIGGWTPAGGAAVSSHYGNAKDADLWTEEVVGIEYPGLDLSFLHPKA